MLQMDFNDTASCLSVCTPIVTKTGLLKLTLSLGFFIYHCNNLGTGLHQFGLGQHTYATRKVLKARADQHQVIIGSGADPYLADTAKLMAPERVSLLAILAMKQGTHTLLRVVLVTFFVLDHHTELSMRDVNAEIVERETELEG